MQAMHEHSAFPKAPALLEYHHLFFIIISRTLVGVWSYPSAGMQLVYSTAPDDWRKQSYDFKGLIVILTKHPSSSSSSLAGSTKFPVPPRHSFLSSIATGRCPRLRLVSAQSRCKSLLVGQHSHVFCAWVHNRTSLMSSSLLLQLCPACHVRLTWMVYVMRGKWSYSCCFVWCCFQ